MGSGQSARKLTINNEEGVIQISTDLVQRLTQNSQRATSPSSEKTGETFSTPSSTPRSSQEKESLPSRTPEPRQQRELPPRPVTSPASKKSPVVEGHPGYPFPEYTFSAYKLLQQREEELRQQEEYWQQRLAKIHQDYDRINKIFDDEYKRAMNEVMSVPGKKNVNLATAVPPCNTNKDKIIQCYKANPKEILKCASVVQEFSNCVDQHRAQIISTRC